MSVCRPSPSWVEWYDLNCMVAKQVDIVYKQAERGTIMKTPKADRREKVWNERPCIYVYIIKYITWKHSKYKI